MPENTFNLNEMLNSPQASALLKDKHALMQLVNSPDAKKLMQLLTKSGGEGLQTAAQSAMNGDSTALMALLDQVVHRPEGAKAVEGISRNVPQK